ncbi:unnamed protein product [Chrysoparadoxa australica]
MTLEDKIGQMIQLDLTMFINDDNSLDQTKLERWIQTYRVGSLFNTPFPVKGGDGGWTADEWRHFVRLCQEIAALRGSGIPLLMAIDTIHGANYVKEATMFPHQIALAASFNPELAFTSGRDSRAAGLNWLFSPVLGIATEPHWSRTYETFGEDPYLASIMGAELIKGIQDSTVPGKDDGEPLKAAACAKHFFAYPPSGGHDRSPVVLGDQALLELYLPPFRAAVESGVMTFMESYNEVDGVPMAASSKWLKDVLRMSLNFQGVLVTDYEEIRNLVNWHHFAETHEEAVQIAMQDTSIDMSMVPLDDSFSVALLALVNDGIIPMSRLDESVLRIMRLKESLGLLDTPVPDRSSPLVDTVGSDKDVEHAVEAARQSITLLKNERYALPLPREDGMTVAVLGPTCQSIAYQAGGWSVHWQGALNDDEFGGRGTTVLEGVKAAAGEAINVKVLHPYLTPTSFHGIQLLSAIGVDIHGVRAKDYDAAISLAASSNAVLLCVGEGNYTEKPGDIQDLALPKGQVDFVREVAASAELVTPIILLLIEGRPRLLGDAVQSSRAVLHAYLPGPWGGKAIGEILFGDVNPSGRLPLTYPRHEANIPMPYHRKPSQQCVNPENGFEYRDCEVEWWFGAGLSYTTFSYSGLSTSLSSVAAEGGEFTVSVTVANTGERAGEDVVLLFMFDTVRRLLKGFARVSLAPGEKQEVQFDLSTDDLSYIGSHGRPAIEGGEVLFAVGPDTDCRKLGHKEGCAVMQVTKLRNPDRPACHAACELWFHGVANQHLCHPSTDGVFGGPSSCMEECESNKWGWDYLDCIEKRAYGGRCDFNRACRRVGLGFHDASMEPTVDTVADEVLAWPTLILATVLGALVGATAVILRQIFVKQATRSRGEYASVGAQRQSAATDEGHTVPDGFARPDRRRGERIVELT